MGLFSDEKSPIPTIWMFIIYPHFFSAAFRMDPTHIFRRKNLFFLSSFSSSTFPTRALVYVSYTLIKRKKKLSSFCEKIHTREDFDSIDPLDFMMHSREREESLAVYSEWHTSNPLIGLLDGGLFTAGAAGFSGRFTRLLALATPPSVEGDKDQNDDERASCRWHDPRVLLQREDGSIDHLITAKKKEKDDWKSCYRDAGKKVIRTTEFLAPEHFWKAYFCTSPKQSPGTLCCPCWVGRIGRSFPVGSY